MRYPPPKDLEAEIAEIRRALSLMRSVPESEKALHKWMAQRFETARIPFAREVPTSTGPVDFVTHYRIAVEVKIKGSALSAYRQLARYLHTDNFSAGVLVTTKAMRPISNSFEGKPVFQIDLWRQFL